MNQKWHQNHQIATNQGNYERVRHFVSPPVYPHAFTAPVLPPRPPNQKPNSEIPYHQATVRQTNFETGSTYKNEKQFSYQTSAYSPRNSKGINVISQLPYKKKVDQGSE